MISKKMTSSTMETYFTTKQNGSASQLGTGKRDAILASVGKRQAFPSEESMERQFSNDNSESATLLRDVQRNNDEISTSSLCVTYQRRLSTVGWKRNKSCLMDDIVENESGKYSAVLNAVVSDTDFEKRENTHSDQSIGTGTCPSSPLPQCWERLFGIKKTDYRKRFCGQYFLDLGQADFSCSTCSVCGLIYARGHENDEKVHSSFHKNHIHGIQFKGWTKERVERLIDNKGSRIILVLPDDPPQQQYKVKEVAAMMEYEMGLAPGWLLQNQCKIYLYVSSAKKVVGCIVAEPIERGFHVVVNSSSSKTNSLLHSTGCDSAPPVERQKIACGIKDVPKNSGRYSLEQATAGTELCGSHELPGEPLVDSHLKSQCMPSKTEQVHGSKYASNFLLFGNIKFTREIETRKAAKSESESDVEDLGRSLMCSKSAVPAACGVRGIWVSHSERRKGIATQLLDVLRKTFFLGSVLRPSQCAFAQPTPDGKAFAACYCQTTEFLVYK